MSWIRVESAAVDPGLAEGLEARVADPCWMLARQWQTGEFKGDDAANPLLVTVEATSVPVDRLVLPGGQAIDLAATETPLEPLVEREPVRAGPAAPRVAAELGRLLLRGLARVAAPDTVAGELRSRFALRLPPAGGLDPVGERRLALLAGAAFDGTALLAAAPDTLAGMLDELGIKDPARERVLAAADDWRRHAEALFSEPQRFSTWDPQRMEYRFALEATADDGAPIRLDTGEGYAGGRLDWYSFDVTPPTAGKGTPHARTHRAELLPAPLRFRGMPADRFWELEEGDVYLGGIEAAPEDLARVAVAGYAVVYGNDWLLVPLTVPSGTLTRVAGLTVLDDFGRMTKVRSAAEVDGGRPDRAFKFFELTGDTSPGAGRAPLLFLPPTVETTDAGRPLEDVRFTRDELANLAWAVEQRIESRAGRPVDVAARRGTPAAAPAPDDAWDLVLSTEVPGNWVPLLPVRLVDAPEAAEGQIMLQRGRVPLPGVPGSSRGALGSILVPDRRLLVHEDEIPRAGLRVVRRFQSARDPAGGLHTWVGRRKGPGRGIGHSGLEFDRLDG
ncbi:MAG TPA: hypothetical protein VH418_00975 [Solirubrobacteraceae bacterium]|jgi:hypothetical protein